MGKRRLPVSALLDRLDLECQNRVAVQLEVLDTQLDHGRLGKLDQVLVLLRGVPGPVVDDQ